MSQPYHSQTVSLKWYLLLPWVVQIVVLSLSVGVLTHWHGRRLINRMAAQLVDESTRSVKERFLSFTGTPFLQLQTHGEALALGLIDLDDPEINRRYFWQQIHRTEAIQSLYYGDENGNFLLVKNQPQAQLHLRNLATEGQRQIFELDLDGNPISLIKLDSFDPRSRPWYWSASDAGDPAWSPIYVFAAEPILGITAAVPFQTQTGTQGVLGIDITLEQLSDFLRGLRVSEWGIAFIVEPDGSLVATSTSEPPFVRTPGGQERLLALKSGDPRIRGLSEFVQDQWQGFDQLTEPQEGSFQANGEPYFINISQLQDPYGLSWYLVVALPESYFLQSIWVNHTQSGLITTVFLAIGIQGLIILYRRIDKPLKNLNKVIQRLESGEDFSVDKPLYFREIELLAKTAQTVSTSLKHSYQEQQTERSLALSVGMIATWKWDRPDQQSQQEWSSESFQLLGLDPNHGDCSRQTFLSLVHPEDRSIVDQQLNGLFGRQRIQTDPYDFRIIRPDNNQIRWIRAWTRVVLNDQGTIIKIIGANQDVTLEKEREAERLRILKDLKESEATFKALVENLPFSVWARNAQEQLFFQNTVDRNYFGDLIGTTLDKLPIMESLKNQNRVLFKKIITNKEVHKNEFSIMVSGQSRFLLYIIAPILVEDRAVGIIGSAIDITDIKEAEMKAQQLAAIVNSSNDAIISTDANGRILTWNPGAEKIYGYTASEIIGQSMAQVAPELKDYSNICPINYTAKHVHKDNSHIDVNINSSGLNDISDDQGAKSWIIRDISEQTKLAKLQDQFISTVSHELRTPLTSIHGSLTAINSGYFGSLEPMGQELLSIAEQNTTRLIRLINNILDLEKLEHQHLPSHPQRCSSQMLIQQACDLMASLARQSAIHFNLDTEPYDIWADPDQIIQVLTNLLSNAIKFSPAHSTITIQSYNAQGDLIINISDPGPGIPSDQLDLIFEPFRQIDASDRRKKGGTGLGLAICRQIIQQHQGQIWAESQVGQGSHFFVQLPLAQDN